MSSLLPAVPNVTVTYHREPMPPGDRVRRFLEAFARMAGKCGRCAVECPVYQATHRAEDVPCARSDLLLRVYRRHFTAEGKLAARLLGTPPLSDADVQEMAEAFYRCTACRRCNLQCPMGLDHGLITHLARYVLSEIGIAPKA